MNSRWTTGIYALAALVAAGAGCGHKSTNPIQDQVDFSDPNALFSDPAHVHAAEVNPDAPVVIVKGTPITQAEWAREGALLLSYLRQIQPDQQQFEQLAPRLMDESMQRLILKKVLAEELASEGITVPQEQIKARIQAMKQALPDAAAWEGVLEIGGLTESDVEREVEALLHLDAFLLARVGDVPAPPEEDIKGFYESKKEQFIQPELADVRNILLQAPVDGPAAERKAAMEKAEMIRSALLEGTDFGELAGRHSDDERTAQQEGRVGKVARRQLPPAIGDIVFTQELGLVSLPIETPTGIHLLLVESRSPERQLELDEVRDTIVGVLKAQAYAAAREAYILSVIQGADVHPAAAAPAEHDNE